MFPYEIPLWSWLDCTKKKKFVTSNQDGVGDIFLTGGKSQFSSTTLIDESLAAVITHRQPIKRCAALLCSVSLAPGFNIKGCPMVWGKQNAISGK